MGLPHGASQPWVRQGRSSTPSSDEDFRHYALHVKHSLRELEFPIEEPPAGRQEVVPMMFGWDHGLGRRSAAGDEPNDGGVREIDEEEFTRRRELLHSGRTRE